MLSANENSTFSEAPAAGGRFVYPGLDPLAGLSLKDDRLASALRSEAYLVFDGAMGTQLQARNLANNGEMPELLNFSRPDDIAAIHASYVAAGADVISTNTFGANALKLEGRTSVAEVYAAAAENARKAGARYVAGDIGPTGALLEPLGTLSFDDAYDLFAEQVEAAVGAGCDLILIETMTDLREAKAALLAAREHSCLPVVITMTFGEDGRTFLGTTPQVAAEVLSSLGAHAVGLNCSLGPDELLECAQAMAVRVRCPLIVQPNAGLPRVQDGETIYDVLPEGFAASMERMMDVGASMVGGCCGTSPAHIAALRAAVDRRNIPVPCVHNTACVLACSQRAVVLPEGDANIAIIGERINPTGKPKLKEALRKGDLDYVVGEAVAQYEAGADVLDVNVGLPELDEPAMLAAVVDKVSATVPLPLVFDSSDPDAIATAARSYAGKPLINSVSGKQESLEAVLPVAKKYGCAVVGLTLDEGGIPPTAEGRFAIAERVVKAAEAYGIPRQDVVIDCLVMSAATNQKEAREILRAISLVKERLGVRTVLGVSNVSFGLPQRDMVNATFLAAAFGVGLDMPILNPLSARYRDTVAAFRVLNGQDEGSATFIGAYAEASDPYKVTVGTPGEAASADGEAPASTEASAGCPVTIPDTLADVSDQVKEAVRLIIAGHKGPMPALTARLLEGHEPLDVVNGVFIPTLDVVGDKFESGEFFLPQLMASAEAVKAGFDSVREYTTTSGALSDNGDRAIILATVKGDIHDIGKNIVKMLLENYGYRVVDLGRDVPPEDVASAALEGNIRLIGLSALMTTTVRSMKDTIALLRQKVLGCTVFVGGAVLTPEYAEQIGADYYAKDAAESARIAERYFASR